MIDLRFCPACKAPATGEERSERRRDAFYACGAVVRSVPALGSRFARTCQRKYDPQQSSEIKCDDTKAMRDALWHYVGGSDPRILSFDMAKPEAVETGWTANTVNLKSMLAELRRRPHSMFPEIDEINCRGSKHCRCDTCYSLRRRLIKELEDQTCDNR